MVIVYGSSKMVGGRRPPQPHTRDGGDTRCHGIKVPDYSPYQSG